MVAQFHAKYKKNEHTNRAILAFNPGKNALIKKDVNTDVRWDREAQIYRTLEERGSKTNYNKGLARYRFLPHLASFAS